MRIRMAKSFKDEVVREVRVYAKYSGQQQTPRMNRQGTCLAVVCKVNRNNNNLGCHKPPHHVAVYTVDMRAVCETQLSPLTMC